jgi:alpha-glucoside transport system substrate-binding protein
MVEPWEQRTGAKVKYTGTRDINTVLTTGVASGVLPDLAGLPGPGQMAEYAQAGKLVALDDVLDLPTYQKRDRCRRWPTSARPTARCTASSSRPPSRA